MPFQVDRPLTRRSYVSIPLDIILEYPSWDSTTIFKSAIGIVDLTTVLKSAVGPEHRQREEQVRMQIAADGMTSKIGKAARRALTLRVEIPKLRGPGRRRGQVGSR